MDYDGISDATSAYLGGSSSAFVFQLVNLIDTAICPADEPGVNYTVLVYIKINRDIFFSALYLHYNTLRFSARITNNFSCFRLTKSLLVC